MQYIVHRRYHGVCLYGEANLPRGTDCGCIGGYITVNDKIICSNKSEISHQYFALNDDGHGLERGRLTQEIQKILSKRDEHYQDRWDKVWDDPICQKYKRPEHADYWLWNHEFFEANIFDLRYIAKLVGVKTK